MKKSLLILNLTITAITISAFGLTNRKTQHTLPEKNLPKDSATIQLSEIGINGGISIDIRTGLKTDFIVDTKKPALNYMVRGYKNEKYHQLITRQKLNSAKTIHDLIDNFPVNWIKHYNSVVISGIGMNENSEAIGSNATLTVVQKKILATASEIHIAIHYQKENYSNKVQNRQLNTSFIVIPKIQAKYEGGYAKMIAYLKENSLNEINSKNLMAPQSTIYFVVNKLGRVENTKITQSSGNIEIDEILLELLSKMPKWTPARNAKGDVVKQKFAFTIGAYGC